MLFFSQFLLNIFGLTSVIRTATKVTQVTPKLEWTPVKNGQIPSEAMDVNPNGMSNINYHFCNVFVKSKGYSVAGTIAPNSNDGCEYEMDGKYHSSKVFNVLTTKPGAKYEFSMKLSDKAVKCSEDSNVPECYLGQSIYGDGICKELPGKVVIPPRKGAMKMIKTALKNEIFRCPFVMYLIEKP